MEPHTRYRIEGNLTCIDIRLRSARQLFDQRDPAPFRERNLDENAVEYLIGAVDDLPKGRPVKVIFWTPAQLEVELPASELCSAVRAHFSYEREKLHRSIRLVLLRGQQIFWLGLAVLTACLVSAELIVPGVTKGWPKLVREGLTITGWVAMWRPLEALLFDWWPLVHKRRTIDRLLAAEIEVRPDQG